MTATRQLPYFAARLDWFSMELVTRCVPATEDPRCCSRNVMHQVAKPVQMHPRYLVERPCWPSSACSRDFTQSVHAVTTELSSQGWTESAPQHKPQLYPKPKLLKKFIFRQFFSGLAKMFQKSESGWGPKMVPSQKKCCLVKKQGLSPHANIRVLHRIMLDGISACST